MTRAGSIVPVLVAGVVLLACAAQSRAADPESIARSELPVFVTETPGRVRLHVVLPEDVPPNSVEGQLAGRNAVVLAQGIGGRQLRSRSLRLSEAAVEDGAQADYEPDRSLTITLRKARPLAGEPLDPSAPRTNLCRSKDSPPCESPRSHPCTRASRRAGMVGRSGWSPT